MNLSHRLEQARRPLDHGAVGTDGAALGLNQEVSWMREAVT